MWRRTTIGLLALAYLCAGSTAQAWTSAAGPLSDAIHQKAIDNVLGPKSAPASAQLDDSDRNVLKNQQTLVDKDQAPEQSAEHAMTGVTESAPDGAKQKPTYIAKSEQLVRAALLTAITQRRANNNKVALPALGQAIHALEDSTSPAHRGFQIWSYKFGIWEMANHVLKERVYPNDSMPDRYQSHLEGSVQYAYDIYMEKEPLPPRFFDPVGGNLILPASYLHAY
jgi:hypothetical protein